MGSEMCIRDRIHGARPDPLNAVAHGVAIKQIDSLPARARNVARTGRSGATPGNELSAGVRQQIQQMAACESGRAGYQRGRGHRGRVYVSAVVSRQSSVASREARRQLLRLALREAVTHRGTPLSAPLKGEKLPSPASVNDRKKRWSDGIGRLELPPRL